MKLVYKIAIAFFCVSAWGSPIYCNAQDTLGINVIERYTLQQVPPSEHFKDNDYSKRFFVQLQTGSSFFLNGISKEKIFKNRSFGRLLVHSYSRSAFRNWDALLSRERVGKFI